MPSKGTLGNFYRQFELSQLERGCYWRCVGGAKGAAEHPAMHSTARHGPHDADWRKGLPTEGENPAVRSGFLGHDDLIRECQFQAGTLC